MSWQDEVERVRVASGIDRIVPGLYIFRWKASDSAGSSIGAVFYDEDGRVWMAPTNWIGPSWATWGNVDRVELVLSERQWRESSQSVESITLKLAATKRGSAAHGDTGAMSSSWSWTRRATDAWIAVRTGQMVKLCAERPGHSEFVWVHVEEAGRYVDGVEWFLGRLDSAPFFDFPELCAGEVVRFTQPEVHEVR